MIDSKIHIAGIAGSLRKGSFNKMLLNAAAESLPEGMTMDIISIKDIPLYNADLDLPDADRRPEAVEKFRNKLEKADAILFSSPEYNYGIPGLLKNAIDWASRGKDSPLRNKPVALIGASPGMIGTARMQIDFLSIFLYMDMIPVYKPEVLLSNANEKFTEDGKLKDEKTKKFLREKMESLKKVVLNQQVEMANV